jgi:hypothetical protein
MDAIVYAQFEEMKWQVQTCEDAGKVHNHSAHLALQGVEDGVVDLPGHNNV